MSRSSIFYIFLKSLGVPCTQDYSDRRFDTMPFKSLFGFSRLLGEYNIPSDALSFDDRLALTRLPLPCLVQKKGKPVVIHNICGGKVKYECVDSSHMEDLDQFEKDWSGIALVAYPQDNSAEPDYRKHRLLEIAGRCKTWIFLLSVAFLVVYGFVTGGLYRHVSTILLVCLSLFGIYISYLLLLKSAHISTSAGDRVCGVLQKGGCDKVLDTKGSEFFGIFKWSEVGLAYFSVTTFTLLAFPQHINYLALLNLFCLPYAFWSVWYQKYRAQHWCTMCLTVQLLLWSSFACYLFGDCYKNLWPLQWPLAVLVASYAAVLFGLNRVTPMIDRKENQS